MDLLLIWSFSSFPDWKARIFPESWGEKDRGNCTSLAYISNKFHILLRFFCFSHAWPFRKGCINRSPICFFDPKKKSRETTRPSATTNSHRWKSPPTRSYIFCMPSTAAMNFCCYRVSWVGDSFSKLQKHHQLEKTPEKNMATQAMRVLIHPVALGVSRITVILTLFCVIVIVLLEPDWFLTPCFCKRWRFPERPLKKLKNSLQTNSTKSDSSTVAVSFDKEKINHS